MSPRKRYNFWIEEAQLNGLKQIKADTFMSESEQIRQAVNAWLKEKGVTVAKGENRLKRKAAPQAVTRKRR